MHIYPINQTNQFNTNQTFRSSFTPTETLYKAFSHSQIPEDKRFIKSVRKLLKDGLDRQITIDAHTTGSVDNPIYQGVVLKAGDKIIKIKSEPYEILNEKLEWVLQSCDTLIIQDSRLAIQELAVNVHDGKVTKMKKPEFKKELQRIKNMIFQQP